MATKDKAKKKAKLRHAEYYDFQKVQDKESAVSRSAGCQTMGFLKAK